MNYSFKTFLKHTAKDIHNQSVNPPVVRASTIIFKSMQDIRKTQNKYKKDPTGGYFDYGRQGTSTTHILQKILTKLEESYHVFLTPTGFGSVFLAIFSVVRPGDEILVSDPVYSPTRLLTQDYLKEYNIKTVFYNPHDLNSLKKKINKKTKLIFMESPSSLTFEIEDMNEIIKIAKKKKIITAIDNSWATPLYFSPIKCGIDISILAATKYISGHADTMLGLITVKNEKLFLKIKDTAVSLGDCPGPEECYLTLRGLRTLATRLEKHRSSSLKIARLLQNNNKVSKVLHPALPKNNYYELWSKYFTGSTGLFSFILKEQSKNKVYKMIDSLKLFKLGFSWGGYESLILPVFPKNERKIAKWKEKGILLRLHVGLENVDDLIKDLFKSFKL